MQFDEDFASPVDFANLYRDLELQVVPAKTPSEDKSWKRPAIKWREHENILVEEKTFQQWYGPDGEFRSRPNMGVVTGLCSKRLVIIDLDRHKNSKAMDWWNDLMDDHHHGQWIQTPIQETGGGGLQMLFHCPEWYTPPTNKTNIGVDIRGQGGFAVLPPSLHESGKNYEWKKGYEPWKVEIAILPEWLVEAIDELVVAHGGSSNSGPNEKTETPDQSINAFGSIVDGREDYMKKMIWAKIVDFKRGGRAFEDVKSEGEIKEAFAQYEQTVKSRIIEPGASNAELLEREGRGWSEFRKKWHIAMSKWDTEVRAAAAVPKKEPEKILTKHLILEETVDETGKKTLNFEPFPIQTVAMIKAMPDPQYLIDKMIIENAFGMIYGTPGGGKTFIALSMALSIAAGLETWFGHKINKHGPVIYISSEGVSDLKFRIAAWEKETGICADDIPFYLISVPINFMDDGEIDRLIASIQYSDFLQGECPVAIFVDTVSRALPGADENLQKDMTLFIKACDKLKIAFSDTVIGVHHTNKNGGMRGSTVFDGAADFIYHVYREEGSSIGEIRAKKIKSAADGWTKFFHLKEVVVDIAGNTSLYAEPTDQTPEQPESEWPSRHICKEILRAMSVAWERGKPWSNQPNTRRDGRYAPMLMTRWEIDEKLAEKMVNQWLFKGLIEVDMVDAKSRTKGIKVIDDLSGGYSSGYNGGYYDD